MSIVSVKEVKDILNISGSSYDNQIQTLIPIIQQTIDAYCDDDFATGSAYPIGLKLPAAKMVGNSIYTKNMGNISVEKIGNVWTTYKDGFPQDIYILLAPYKKSLDMTVKFI